LTLVSRSENVPRVTRIFVSHQLGTGVKRVLPVCGFDRARPSIGATDGDDGPSCRARSPEPCVSWRHFGSSTASPSACRPSARDARGVRFHAEHAPPTRRGTRQRGDRSYARDRSRPGRGRPAKRHSHKDAPSNDSTGSFVASMPARQRRFTAIQSAPSLPLPREKERTPHVLQKKWCEFFLLNW